jgi:hypothetical protein
MDLFSMPSDILFGLFGLINPSDAKGALLVNRKWNVQVFNYIQQSVLSQLSAVHPQLYNSNQVTKIEANTCKQSSLVLNSAWFIKKFSSIQSLKLKQLHNLQHDISRQIHHLVQMTNLTSLSLHDARFSGSVFQWFSNLRQLNQLHLVATPTDSIDWIPSTVQTLLLAFRLEPKVEHLQKLTGLRQLTILQCGYFSDEDLQYLSSLKLLETITFVGTYFSDEGVKELCHYGLPNLTKLMLMPDKITAEGFQYFTRLTNLQDIDFCLPEESMQHMAQLINLTRICLHSVTGSIKREIAYLSRLTKLQSLGVGIHDEADIESLVLFISKLTKLYDLRLDRCGKMTDGHLDNLAALTKLTSLHLGKPLNITKKGFQCLSALTNLQCFEYSSNADMDTTVLKQCFPTLTIKRELCISLDSAMIL